MTGLSSFIVAFAFLLPAMGDDSPSASDGISAPIEGDPASHFLSALGSRRLDGLLEEYCREQMNAQSSAPVSPVLAVELAYSLSRRASETSDPVVRDQLWKSSDEILAKATNEAVDVVTRARLALERGSIALAEGEWLRQWDELQGQIDQAPSAIAKLQAAVSQLRQLRDAIQLSPPPDKAKLRTASEKETSQQLQQLLPLISYQLGSAELAFGQAFPSGSEDRKRELTAAAEHLRSVAIDPSHGEFGINATLKLSEAFRALGVPEQAWPMLVTIDLTQLTPAIRDRILAERVELLLAENRVIEAIEVVHEERRHQEKVPPAWEYLYLKVLLRQAAQMPSDPGAVGKLQASALRQLRLLDAVPDRLWLRRGEVLLAQHARHLLLRESTEYRQAAEILTRSGDHSQAARVYAQAADQARAKGDIDNAMTLLEESARSQEKAGDYAKARETFKRIVQAWPDQPTAPEALLLAAINARRAYLADHQPASYSELHRLVQEHLKEYPNHETTGDVRYLLGTMKKAERKYGDAVSEFLAVPASHRLWSSSRLAASRVYELWKRPLATDGPSDGTLGQVIAYHESLISPLTPNPPPFDVAGKAELTIRLARFLLDLRVDRAADAERWLASLLLLPGVPHEWIQEARRYQILALVRQDRFNEAEALAEIHSRSSMEEVLASVQLLNDDAEIASELERNFTGRLQTHLVKQAREQVKTLPEAERLDWDLALAHIELNLANDREIVLAIDRLQQLRKKYPRDARIAELLGLCYSQTQRYQSATLIWRSIIVGTKEGSPLWFRAKLNLVSSLRRAGQSEQAREVLQLVEVLHPELGGPPLRQQFRNEHQILTADK